MRTAILFFLACLMVQSAYLAGADTVPIKPDYMALFKNGTALVIGKAELPGKGGKHTLHPLPDATLGSFWLNWPNQVELSGITATQIKTATAVPAVNIQELLQANIGKTLKLQINDALTEARIVDVPKRQSDPPYWPADSKIIPPPSPPQRGEIVLIEDSNGMQAVPLDWVKSIHFEDSEPVLNIEHEESHNAITINQKGDSDDAVYVTYLAKGAAWSPSYVIDISDEDQAKIAAKAVVMNDLIPMDDTDVELITGYPHIQFEDTPSAFSLENIQSILGRSSNQSARKSMDFSNAQMRAGAGFAMAESMPSMPQEAVSGESEEDLYFYSLDRITLKKGERGYFPLFAAEVDFNHLYTWDIPDYVDQYSNYRREQLEQTPDVWHTLQLTNNTGQPWTSAPAMTKKGNRILGQDTIKYTPSGAETTLKITAAPFIKADHNEYELERQAVRNINARQPQMQVKLQGEMVLTNYSEKTVTLRITKTLSGEVLEFDGSPEVKKLGKGLSSMNPRSQLVWEVDLEPGADQSTTLTYTYQAMLRN